MNHTAHPALDDRHVLITGASQGIGFEVARLALDAGARVTLLARSAERLSAAAASLCADAQRVYTVQADITNEKSIGSAFDAARERFGPINILVNNAGQAQSERFEKMNTEFWNRMLQVNLTGTYQCIAAALPDMLTQGWGRIVNVASVAGLKGYGYVTAYCAAKHGVVGLTRALALELATKNITVNAVCPGYTDTPLLDGAVANMVAKTGMTADKAKAALASNNPQGRLVQPEEVAHAVLWLCLPQSASINGQAIPVDGGEKMAG
ncbi:MAG TPA: SDR family NAD(P)-dependent oxidoreductase [Advenella sp.]|nr:SDR family NAD(P)-dependent oxidoreductase [Advenella sp.]